MGNILSNDEKLSNQRKRELYVRKNHRHHYSDRLPHRSQYYKYKKKKTDFLRNKNESNEHFGIRSQSLNAIIDDFYWFEADDIIENKLAEIKFDANKPLIPRIKLKKVPIVKEDGRFKQLLIMSSEPDLFTAADSANSSSNLELKNENDDFVQNDKKLLNQLTILIKDRNYEEITNKPEDNYFSKTFDESIKRMQQIEKEHELCKPNDSVLQVYLSDKNTDKTETSENNENFYKGNCDAKVELKNLENGLDSENEKRVAGKDQSSNLGSDVPIIRQKNLTDSITIVNRNVENEELKRNENNERISEWYSNLKGRFEKAEKENNQTNQEMTCRITGAILKNSNECSNSEEKEKNTRLYFSKLVKSNKSLVDEELPDPDKVKSIRAMFQENLNSTLKKRLDKKLGGSLQNINIRSSEQHLMRPLSAQCYRNDDTRDDKSFKNVSATDISGTVKDDGKDYSIERKKLLEKYEKDSKLGKEYRNRKMLQSKWTDTGSLSSGVSSDLSSYDTDIESFSREGTEQDEIVVSDDDLLEEVNDKHYVQNEVLERIRAFGTSVTYYGGEMISCSVGPLLSPTTQAIMEEISEKYGHEATGTRSFEEFYRKYVETNEPNRKKKISRARSFGQSDVFQKPNVLNNSEIDLFKKDLELEIGIKKPVGICQNSFKKKSVNSASLQKETECLNEEEKKANSKCKPTEADALEGRNSMSNEQINIEIESTNGSETDLLLNENRITEECEKKAETEKCKVNKEFETEGNLIEGAETETLCSSNQSDLVCTLTSETYKECEKYNYKPTEKIFFGYEKSSETKSEEFEVGEVVTEKLQKPEEKNALFTETKQIYAINGNPEEKNSNDNTTFENKQSQSFSNLEEKENGISAVKYKRQSSAPERGEKYTGDKFSRCISSKWPIETTVMVDIQKNSEQTPKIVKNEKIIAKTKLRLF